MLVEAIGRSSDRSCRADRCKTFGAWWRHSEWRFNSCNAKGVAPPHEEGLGRSLLAMMGDEGPRVCTLPPQGLANLATAATKVTIVCRRRHSNVYGEACEELTALVAEVERLSSRGAATVLV